MIESQSHNSLVSKSCENCIYCRLVPYDGFSVCLYELYGICTPKTLETWTPRPSTFCRMTNKEAADILKRIYMPIFGIMPRGNGKTYMLTQVIEALTKAIKVLEETPDE